MKNIKEGMFNDIKLVLYVDAINNNILPNPNVDIKKFILLSFSKHFLLINMYESITYIIQKNIDTKYIELLNRNIRSDNTIFSTNFAVFSETGKHIEFLLVNPLLN